MAGCPALAAKSTAETYLNTKTLDTRLYTLLIIQE